MWHLRVAVLALAFTLWFGGGLFAYWIKQRLTTPRDGVFRTRLAGALALIVSILAVVVVLNAMKWLSS